MRSENSPLGEGREEEREGGWDEDGERAERAFPDFASVGGSIGEKGSRES